MAGPFLILYVLATVWFCSWPAAASLYPTKPTATTIYQAGQPAEVRWIEDGKNPLLNLTGTVRIDLYEGNNTYLATLAKEVDPNSLSTILFIPTSHIPRNYHLFTLRFITVAPHQTIYTADFTIIPSSVLRSTFSASSHSTQAATVTSTIISRIVSTETPKPSTSQKGSAGLGLRWRLGARNIPGGPFTMDAEKMKFRLMFIVWPALMGLSMAL